MHLKALRRAESGVFPDEQPGHALSAHTQFSAD
jgi:hypothetical protein